MSGIMVSRSWVFIIVLRRLAEIDSCLFAVSLDIVVKTYPSIDPIAAPLI